MPAYERAKLALRLEPIIAAKAKENQRAAEGGDRRSDDFQGCQKSDNLEKVEPIDTKKEVAKAANLSHDSIAKVKKIEAKATPEQKATSRTRARRCFQFRKSFLNWFFASHTRAGMLHFADDQTTAAAAKSLSS